MPKNNAPRGEPHELRARLERRVAANVDASAPSMGLALSGGGIRSATFCFGLLRALAKNGVLRRFDYLSTVSGGGYIGSALGRLFHSGAAGNPKSVEDGVADDGSLLVWWLRNNGRFLAPSGARDLLQTLSSQLRGFIATQVETLVMIVLLASVITLPHLVYSFVFAFRDGMPVALSVWWWLLPIPAWGALIACYGYWFLGKETGGGAGTAVLAAILGIYMLAQAAVATSDFNATILSIGAFALLPSPAAWACARISGIRRTEAENRVRYTTALSWSLRVLAIVFAFGALDMLSWAIRIALNLLLESHASGNVATGVGTTTVLIAIARFLLPMLQNGGQKNAVKLPWIHLANILGLILVLALTLFWTTIFQMVVFPRTSEALGGILRNAYLRWTTIAVISVIYIALNGRALQQLNFSSLHFFYRSRIARAYVSVGNTKGAGSKTPRFPDDPICHNDGAMVYRTKKVTTLLDGDDVAMGNYTPHEFGGPIHLVNCCINQTVDDRTGTYNADRKGINLTVSALGIETGTQLPPDGSAARLAGTTLAQWIAISGAALGSGMGSFTRPGIAALAFLSGLRLGYWQSNLMPGTVSPLKFMAKYSAMLREMFARFPGLGSAQWYLSDGGHFDNTGVYTLLKRRLDLIILVDCGADPEYRFSDVENLVRKARIDYDATIEFVEPSCLDPDTCPIASYVATPDTLSATPDASHLLLAQITYSPDERGTLLIVKPHISTDMPLDIAGYADSNCTFPQQSTSQQFFSEAQWESYCELGVLLGKHVNEDVLAKLPEWVWHAQVTGTNSAKLSRPARRRSKGRNLVANVGASIGAGAVLTALLAGWQAWDGHRKQELDTQLAVNKEAREDDRAFAKQAQPFLEYLRDSERQKLSYDPKMSTGIRQLKADALLYPGKDQQRPTIEEASDLLSKICERTQNQVSEEIAACESVFINSFTPTPEPSFSEFVMDNYKGWRDPSALEILSASDGNTTSSNAQLPPPLPSAIPNNGSSIGIVASATTVGFSRPAQNASVAAPASSPAQELKGARDEAAALCGRPDQPFTLYTQIYDEQQRPLVDQALSTVRDLGVIASSVENVSATASRKGRQVPYEWKSPTVLYSAGGKACATALVNWANLSNHQLAQRPANAVALPVGVGKPNVLELWIPRNKSIR